MLANVSDSGSNNITLCREMHEQLYDQGLLSGHDLAWKIFLLYFFFYFFTFVLYIHLQPFTDVAFLSAFSTVFTFALFTIKFIYFQKKKNAAFLPAALRNAARAKLSFQLIFLPNHFSKLTLELPGSRVLILSCAARLTASSAAQRCEPALTKSFIQKPITTSLK
jgi:hypothetical protein